MSFALLWSKTLYSSIWRQESKETRLVWVTMLMMKDQDGKIQSSVIGLADMARVTLEECQEALKIFLAPDPNDSSGVEEGRRIRVIPGGWEIVNNDLYRFSTEERREFWRQAKAAQRAKQAAAKAKREEKRAKKEASKSAAEVSAAYSSAEHKFVEAEKSGASAEQLDKIVTESLPAGLQ